MSLESKQRDGVEEALWSALRRLQERLLLTQDQLLLAQAARSPDVEQLRARTARLDMAVEATRQLALLREDA
jgi:two-component system chemotaxis response regulator CheB